MEIIKLTPSLQNILDQVSLKWVFVGGEGGVGKTLISCSLAVLLSKMRESVLLLSLDSSNSITDVFEQKFSVTPTLVKGFSNLYAMETGPGVQHADTDSDAVNIKEFLKNSPEFEELEVQDLLKDCPGFSETVSFTSVIKLLRSSRFSVIVLVAGTIDRTIRFLSFPDMIENGILKLLRDKPQLSAFVSPVIEFLGFQDVSFYEDILPTSRKMNQEFHDSNTATVVCVCKAESSSVNEILCFISNLITLHVDVHNIVINRVLFQESNEKLCCTCLSRIQYQRMCIEEIPGTYEKFHIINLPLLTSRVRGNAKIVEFAEYLIKPYNSKKTT